MEEAYQTFQKVLNTEPEYTPALISMASYYDKNGEDSLYRAQLDGLLLNKKTEVTQYETILYDQTALPCGDYCGFIRRANVGVYGCCL